MSEDVGPGNEASKLVHLSVVGKRYWRNRCHFILKVHQLTSVNTVDTHLFTAFFPSEEGWYVSEEGGGGR